MSSGGSMLAFEVRGGSPAVTAFAESCRVARIALSLGGPETLITHPATIASRYTPSERAELGITDGLVRLSPGHEHADHLQARSGERRAGRAGVSKCRARVSTAP